MYCDVLRRLETSMYIVSLLLIFTELYVFSSTRRKSTIMRRVFLCLPTQVIGSIHQINEKYMSITCISISLTVDHSRNNLTKITAFRGLYSTKNKMIPRSVQYSVLFSYIILCMAYARDDSKVKLWAISV